jgi:hypothetical protein
MTLKIESTVREDARTSPKDVLEIKQILVHGGYYKVPDYGLTPYPDKTLFKSIRAFQKENDLKADGVIHPDGPTLKTINALYFVENELPAVRGPVLRCPECGGPHGGSKGDLCPECFVKS